MIVDVHGHFFPERFLEALAREGTAHSVRAERGAAGWRLGTGRGEPAPLDRVFWDVAARLEAVRRLGVEVQALSMSPPMLYWAPPALARDLASVFNDEIAAICAAHPDRFIGQATLPLQDVEAAVAETERAARAGFRGVYIGTNVSGRYLDDPVFTPLWETAVRCGLPVFTHPINNAGVDRMAGWHLGNAVGNPGETALAGARLIMSGVLHRFPALQVVLAHGGGTLAFLAGRLDHAYEVRDECRSAIPAAPSTYLTRLHFDTITFNDGALRYLIQAVGADRVLLGTDHAYDMADLDAVARIRRLGLGPRDTEAILGGNAGRLLGVGDRGRGGGDAPAAGSVSPSSHPPSAP